MSRGITGIFGLAVEGGRKLLSRLSLRSAFGASVGAATVAPNATGEFIGSRITGLFSGVARGVGRGMLESPLVMAGGLTALAVVGSHILNKFSR